MEQEGGTCSQTITHHMPLMDAIRTATRKAFQRDYICCSVTGRPRSKDFHWFHYKILLEENHLPNIRWHDLRSTFCTLLLKNDFNPKAVSKLMGHAKGIITMDVYGDNRGIIADCADKIQPFINEVLPTEDLDSELRTENIEVVVPADEYLI